MGNFTRDTWLIPVVIKEDDNDEINIVEDPGGANEASIKVELTAGTYYLHDDETLHSTYKGLYYAIRNVLNNGTGSDGTLTGTVTNTYSWENSNPSTSTGVPNAGLTLKAASATYSFKYDWDNGGVPYPNQMDPRWFGEKDASAADRSSATSGSDEVIISAYCTRARIVTTDLGDGAAQTKSAIPRKVLERSSDRVSESVTTNWGEEKDRRFTYQDVWPALVDEDRAGDTGYATALSLGDGDKNNTWYQVWDSLTDGDTLIVVHNSVSDLQVDTHSYEVVKLAEDPAWEDFQFTTRNSGDFRTISFRVAVLSGTYEH